jgi:hypothetical protein
MSGPVEVRDFLLQQETRDPSLGIGGLPVQRSGDGSRVTEDQVRRAQLAVAAGSQSVEDCQELLDMLGLVPGEDGVAPVRR